MDSRTHTQYPEKLNVWADVLNNVLIDPFFIDSNLIATKYEDMLRNEIFPVIIAIVDENFERMIPARRCRTRFW